MPTLDEVKAQTKKWNDRMAEIEKDKEKAALSKVLEQSISREMRCSESNTDPRAFAAEEQVERDTENGIYETLVEEKTTQERKGLDKNNETEREQM